jgi:uncharacterized protein
LHLVRAAAQLNGEIALTGCARLMAAYGPQSRCAHYEFDFGVDEDDIKYVRGKVAAKVDTVCSRCAAPVVIEVRASVALALAADESGCADIPDRYEPLIVTSEGLSLSTLVEDEILLAMPLAPAHAEGACAPVSSATRVGDGPFAGLARLRGSAPD